MTGRLRYIILYSDFIKSYDGHIILCAGHIKSNDDHIISYDDHLVTVCSGPKIEVSMFLRSSSLDSML